MQNLLKSESSVYRVENIHRPMRRKRSSHVMSHEIVKSCGNRLIHYFSDDSNWIIHLPQILETRSQLEENGFKTAFDCIAFRYGQLVLLAFPTGFSEKQPLYPIYVIRSENKGIIRDSAWTSERWTTSERFKTAHCYIRAHCCIVRCSPQKYTKPLLF